MKILFRLTILVVIALTLSSGSVFAATWQPIYGSTGAYYDTDEMCFGTKLSNTNFLSVEPDFTRIVCWTKTVFTAEEASLFAETLKDSRYYRLGYTINLITISIPNQTYTSHRCVYISVDGTVINDSDDEFTFDILPTSWTGRLYDSILNYARINKDILVQNTIAP